MRVCREKLRKKEKKKTEIILKFKNLYTMSLNTDNDSGDTQNRLLNCHQNDGTNGIGHTNNIDTTSIIGKKTNGTTTTTTSPPSLSLHQQQQHRQSSSALMKIKTYLLALRPWSLSASLMPTILGSAIAFRTPAGHNEFNFLIFLLTIFTVITVHGAGNVVNTYFDFVKGIDNRKSDDRTLVDHILTKDEVKKISIK